MNDKLYNKPRYYHLAFPDAYKMETAVIATCFSKHVSFPVKHVLEAACGTGRMLVELPKHGYRMTGYDISPEMVAYSAKRLVKAGLEESVTVVQGDMASIRFEEKYDAGLNFINSIGYLTTDDDILNHLKNAGDSILYGYSNSGQRVYKVYINNYTDTCGGSGGGSDGPVGDGDFGIDGIEPPPLPCPYRDTAVTVYVRGKDGKVLAECGQQWAVPRAKYVYAGDQRIAMYNSGYLYFYLNDHLGSARVVIDTTGTVKDEYYTSSFGAPTGQTVSLNQRYRYTGKPFDEDGGIDIYYYGARYYDPELGRFLAVDPLASMNPGWSPYVYVKDNPLIRIDPFGLTDITINIQRTTETKRSTIGKYTVTNSANRSKLSGSTLELPWKNNQAFKSRIKVGSYSANLRTSKGKFSYPRITLEGVPGRSDIVIHRGNTADDTEGCPLVGKTAGEDRVNESEAALTEITDYVQTIQTGDKKKGEKTTITVKVDDPPGKKEDKNE